MSERLEPRGFAMTVCVCVHVKEIVLHSHDTQTPDDHFS